MRPSGWRLAYVFEPDDDSREWGVSYRRAVEDGTLGLSLEVVEATHVVPWHREVRGERLGAASVDGREARVWRSDLGGRPNGFHALTRLEDGRFVSVGAYPARDEDFAAEEWEELLASVRLVPRAEAEARMPAAMILPREERDFVRLALASMFRASG